MTTTVIGEGALKRALTHWSEVFGFALHLTGDRDRAQDLCQETYLRLARVPAPVDLDRPLRPLLFTIVRNLTRSDARRRRPASLETATDERAADPAERAVMREDIELLRRRLNELDATWRAMLYLRDGLDLTYREIAEVLERSEDVVRTTLHRARLRLHEAMKSSIRENDDD